MISFFSKTKNILFIFLFPVTAIAQNYEIVYHEYYVALNGGSLDVVKEKLIQVDTNKETDLSSVKRILLYNQGVSTYGSEKKSKVMVDEEKSNSSEIYTTRIELPSIYVNQSENLYLKKYPNYRPDLYGEDILVVDKLPQYNWELTDIKEKVSGYTCKLAKTTDYSGNSILVWYTDEIPINDGPREFWGLPGLIIQLRINEAVLVVAKSIKKLDKKINIKKIEGGNVMSLKEFLTLKKELEKPGERVLPDGTVIRVN